jgi:hypothetical protein
MTLLTTEISAAFLVALAGCSSPKPWYGLEDVAITPSTITSGDTVTVTVTSDIAVGGAGLGMLGVNEQTTESDGGTTWNFSFQFDQAPGEYIPTVDLFEEDPANPSLEDEKTMYVVDPSFDETHYVFTNAIYEEGSEGIGWIGDAKESDVTDIVAPVLTVE